MYLTHSGKVHVTPVKDDQCPCREEVSFSWLFRIRFKINIYGAVLPNNIQVIVRFGCLCVFKEFSKFLSQLDAQ
ncbi:hypothetical protein D3C87_2020590 [compost metagenome]